MAGPVKTQPVTDRRLINRLNKTSRKGIGGDHLLHGATSSFDGTIRSQNRLPKQNMVAHRTDEMHVIIRELH